MKSISVIMATLNSGPILKECLESVRSQNYDQTKIEIIAADGGSKDKTLEILKEYRAKIIPENTGSPEAAKAVALRYAQNELILEIDSDNILPHQNWLAKMVSFFDQEPDIVGCYPWRYSYRKNDKPLNRYFSLFGVNDPVAHFLKKADRQSYLSSKWSLSGKARDKGDYFLVEFTTENLPTIGANGFLIKRDLLMKAKVDEKHFFHIDVNWDLVNQGYNQYAVVKNDIIHASGEKFWNFFKKRKRYAEDLYQRDFSQRRFFLYDKKKDRKRIIAFSFYSLTLIGPLFEAFKGYLKIKDIAWFLHPIVCFITFWIYFTSTIKARLKHF